MDAEQIRQAATAHFKEERGALVSVDVPEWGEGCKVYHYKAMNVAEVEAVAPFIGVNTQTMYLKTFILCARDDQGARLFSMAAEKDIRSGTSQIDPVIINRIVDKMGLLSGANGEAEDDAKKP